jgi:hypothetical protein
VREKGASQEGAGLAKKIKPNGTRVPSNHRKIALKNILLTILES